MNKYDISINTINAIINLQDEAEQLYNDPTQTILVTKDDLKAVYTAVKSMTNTAKPRVMRDVLEALENAPQITPEEIDLYIPHVNTPKTTESFMVLAQNGLPHLRGLWFLTDYKSDELCSCGPEIIVDTKFDKKDTFGVLMLNADISKYFLHHECVNHRLNEDVLREGRDGFDLVLAREILEGRVRKMYFDGCQINDKEEEQNDEQQNR